MVTIQEYTLLLHLLKWTIATCIEVAAQRDCDAEDQNVSEVTAGRPPSLWTRDDY